MDPKSSKACGVSSEAGRLAFSRSSVDADVFLAERRQDQRQWDMKYTITASQGEG